LRILLNAILNVPTRFIAKSFSVGKGVCTEFELTNMSITYIVSEHKDKDI